MKIVFKRINRIVLDVTETRFRLDETEDFTENLTIFEEYYSFFDKF